MEKGGSSAIFVGIGANLDHPIYGAPRRALEAALAELERRSVRVLRLSPWYRTAPVPVSDQPWYLNAVVEVGTDLPADSLLARLHEVEELFGRVRTVANAARVIDMDLLDFRGEITVGGPGRAILPHPRMEGRAFVLRPLADLAPDWCHPQIGVSIRSLVAALPQDQRIERVP